MNNKPIEALSVEKPGAGRRRKRIISLVVTAFVLSGVAGYFYLQTPHFNGSSPVSIQVEVRSPRDYSVIMLRGGITNQTACNLLLRELSSARKVAEHKCGQIGSFNVCYENGRTDTIDFLPGHSPLRYEIRYENRMYGLSRKKSAQILKDAGIDTTKIPGLE